MGACIPLALSNIMRRAYSNGHPKSESVHSLSDPSRDLSGRGVGTGGEAGGGAHESPVRVEFPLPDQIIHAKRHVVLELVVEQLARLPVPHQLWRGGDPAGAGAG